MVASRAPDGQRLVARPVEIDEHPARDERHVECLCSIEALLLGDREEQLERPVQDRVIVRDSHRRRDPDPVVRAERSALGLYPVVLDANVEPALAWVERARRVTFADHVQVRLEDDDRRALVTRRRGDADDDVPRLVDRRLQRSGRRPGEDVLSRGSFLPSTAARFASAPRSAPTGARARGRPASHSPSQCQRSADHE